MRRPCYPDGPRREPRPVCRDRPRVPSAIPIPGNGRPKTPRTAPLDPCTAITASRSERGPLPEHQKRCRPSSADTLPLGINRDAVHHPLPRPLSQPQNRQEDRIMLQRTLNARKTRQAFLKRATSRSRWSWASPSHARLLSSSPALGPAQRAGAWLPLKVAAFILVHAEHTNVALDRPPISGSPQMPEFHPVSNSNSFPDALPTFPDDSAHRDWLIEALGEAICRKLGLYPIPENLKLSVVIPVYNERRRSTRSCAGCAPSRSGSRSSWSTTARPTAPATSSARSKSARRPEGRLPERNQGKGAALRTGFRDATGDVVIVQDADLEYDPSSIPQLLQPIVEGQADVVFGSRFIGETHRVLYFWHSLANKCLTLLSNMFTNLNLTDMEVCYKVFRREIIQGIKLKSDRFGFEPEVTAKVARFKIPGENGQPRALPDLRDPGLLSRPDLSRRQEDRPQGRLPGLYCIIRYAIAD